MPPSTSSSSLLLITAGTLAIGSLLFFSRNLLPSSPTTTTTTHREYHTNLQQRRFNIRRLDLSFRIGRNRRIVLLIQAATFLVHHDGTRTQLWFSIRIGGSSVEKEVNVLMILLLLKYLMMPVLVEMMEEVEFCSVLYLTSLRLPLIAWATS